MPWTTLSDAIVDLRNLVSDNATDKLSYRKKLIGRTDGANLRFKSFEFRRITNFKTETDQSLGVFVDGVRLDITSGINADGPEVGEVILLTPAPTNNQIVEGSYYVQWFLDSELSIFLKNAAQWIQSGEDATKIPAGLQPAALYFAGQEAMHKLAVRWTQRMSEIYKLEDAPKISKATIDGYRNLANDYKKKSEDLRKQYYSRQDNAEAPLYGVSKGSVREVVPRR